MTKSLRIDCPKCGTEQWVSVDKVPDGGAWGRCAVCRERIFIRKDNLPAPVEVPALSEAEALAAELTPHVSGAPRPPSATVVLKTPAGEERIPERELEERIRRQQVLASDLVSLDAVHFEPVQKLPDFTQLFEGFPTVVPRRCWTHPDRAGEKICARCQRCYCAECTPPPQREGKPLRLCRACGGVLQDTDPGWRESPYWRRLGQVLRFPIGGSAWRWTLGLGLVLWVAGLSLVTTPLYLLGWTFFIYVLKESAKGKRRLEVEPKKTDAVGLVEQSLVALMVTGAIAGCFVVISALLPFGLASILSFFLGLAVFGLYPMALGTAVLSDRPLRAFHLRSLVQHIYDIGEHYLTMLLGLLALGVAAFLLQVGLGLIPGLGHPLAHLAQAYGSVLAAQIIGWTFYLSLGRLGWRRGPVV